jgi:hypothetical protein
MSIDNTVRSWFLKYILPVIIVPILTSSIIAWGSVRSLETQSYNDGKRIDQIEKSTNINRVDISKTIERVSKIETIIESIDRTLARQADLQDKNISEMRKIRGVIEELSKSVAILKDREEREIK